MPFRPGSNQYVGVTPRHEVIPLGPLPLLNAEVAGEAICVGMGRVTLLCQYAKVEKPPNGEEAFLGTGVVIGLDLSPYINNTQLPAGELEWWPVSVIETEAVANCTVNVMGSEYGEIEYCAVSLDDTLEAFTLDFSLPTHAQRIRVRARELDEEQEHGEGEFGCYALLSPDPGGEFGWTLKAPPAAVAILGAVTVNGTVAVSSLPALPAGGNNVGDVDIAEKTLVPLNGTYAVAAANVLVAGAANKRIVVSFFSVQNEVATEQIATLHEEAAATKGIRLFCPADAAGWGRSTPLAAGREFKLDVDKDLCLTLSAATATGFSLLYYIEDV